VCRPRGSAASLATTQLAATDAGPEGEWIGVYASTSEIRGFSKTALALERGPRDEIGYRLRSHSDVVSAQSIEQDERSGGCLTDGRTLYLPEAYGWVRDGKPRLRASITRFTRLRVNGRTVLMRDDALRAFREENKLYDYGILVKVSDHAGGSTDLREVEHPSIKVLYSDPAKPWSDPFVHGPNKR
jgi:hypothetical protein